jgi:hypothetical protein
MRIKKQSTEIGLWVVLLLVVPRLPTSSLAFVNSPVMKANGRHHHIGGFLGSSPNPDYATTRNINDEHKFLRRDRPAIAIDINSLLTLQEAPDLLSPAAETTASTSATQTVAVENDSKLSSSIGMPQLWKRRLITREDWAHLHKITGIIFMISSLGLAGYGIQDLVAHGWTQPIIGHGKPFLSLLLLMIFSSVTQSCSSIRMASKYRRGQPAVRNTFLCNAMVAILGSVSALWSSPWYPNCLNGRFSRGFYVIMNLMGLLGTADNLVHLKALIASRQLKKRDSVEGMSRLDYWKDVLIYVMPILIGAPFFVSIAYVFGIRHDRTFYLQLLQRPGLDHLGGGSVYAMTMAAIGASYSSLIVTLRDKKLIGKQAEGTSLTVVGLRVAGSLYQALKNPGTIPKILGLM